MLLPLYSLSDVIIVVECTLCRLAFSVASTLGLEVTVLPRLDLQFYIAASAYT